MGRFINADKFILNDQGVIGNNLFSYGLNNPVNKKDETGTFALTIALGIACLVVAAVACVLYVEEVNRHRNTIGGNGESFVDSMYEGINDAIESVETIIAIEEELGSYIVEAVNNDATDEGDSEPDHMLGEDGVQTTSKTLDQNGDTERIDVENPNPGKRPGQIHYHDKKNNKYIYDIAKKILVDSGSGKVASDSVQKVLNQPWVKKAIKKGIEIYLGE